MISYFHMMDWGMGVYDRGIYKSYDEPINPKTILLCKRVL